MSLGRRLGKITYHNWNKPVLVKFFNSTEFAVSGAEYYNNFHITLAAFNNDNLRQQLYGYVELFDQFKIIGMHLDMHFKTSAEFTDLNTNIPEVFWAYDVDMKGQMIDLFNICKLQNMRHKLMPPMTHLRLFIKPRWKEKRLSVALAGNNQQIDTDTGVASVDNPWIDTHCLTMKGGEAPDLKANNGYAIAIKNATKRTVVVHTSIYVVFRGRKNNQSYVTQAAKK